MSSVEANANAEAKEKARAAAATIEKARTDEKARLAADLAATEAAASRARAEEAEARQAKADAEAAVAAAGAADPDGEAADARVGREELQALGGVPLSPLPRRSWARVLRAQRRPKSPRLRSRVLLPQGPAPPRNSPNSWRWGTTSFLSETPFVVGDARGTARCRPRAPPANLGTSAWGLSLTPATRRNQLTAITRIGRGLAPRQRGGLARPYRR